MGRDNPAAPASSKCSLLVAELDMAAISLAMRHFKCHAEKAQQYVNQYYSYETPPPFIHAADNTFSIKQVSEQFRGVRR